MRIRDHHRPTAALLASLAVAVGLAACGSSDASGDTPPPATSATQSAPESSTTAPVVMTDAEIADLERQLDEIDQLLGGIDADLAQD